MIAQTYQCSCADGIEYGWTIKESPDHDDTLYDIVLGRYNDEQGALEAVEAWKETRAAAEAFAAALPKGSK